jgi:hypothetical protein
VPATNTVNWFQFAGSVTGANLNVLANGLDANIGITYGTQGNSSHTFVSYFAEQFYVDPTANAINQIHVTGSANGNATKLSALGASTDVDLDIITKGASKTSFISNSTTQFRVVSTATAVNYLQVTGGAVGAAPALSAQGTDTNISSSYTAKGSGAHSFYTNGSTDLQFRIAHTAGAINWLKVTGSALTFPTLSAQGSGTNIAIVYTTKGTEPHYFQTDNAVSTQFVIAHTASAVNYHQMTGSATGTAIVHSAQGSDTNIDLALTPKGTGVLAFGTYTAGIIAQAGYITIKDAGGTTRRLLVG